MVLIGVIVAYSYRGQLLHRNPLLTQYEKRITELSAVNAELQTEINRIGTELRAQDKSAGAAKKADAERAALEAQLSQAQKKLAESQSVVQSAQLELAGLRKMTDDAGAILSTNQATIQGLTQELSDLQHQLAQSQSAAASAGQEAGSLRERAVEAERALAADQVRIEELKRELDEKTADWERDRQLLSMGRDVTDLMGARNLHIVDVVDTDARGKDRASFGRIFFTEDKSLIFYAYDLNEARIEKANFEYRIWGRKEGDIQQVKNLGIFYVDNRAQRRWVFKTNDTKVLREIDSIFVTLEPVRANPKIRNGTRLMYAYLRGQPNHK